MTRCTIVKHCSLLSAWPSRHRHRYPPPPEGTALNVADAETHCECLRAAKPALGRRLSRHTPPWRATKSPYSGDDTTKPRGRNPPKLSRPRPRSQHGLCVTRGLQSSSSAKNPSSILVDPEINAAEPLWLTGPINKRVTSRCQLFIHTTISGRTQGHAKPEFNFRP